MNHFLEGDNTLKMRDGGGLSSEEYPIVYSKDEEMCEDYCTKGVILEFYDEMAEAIRTGRPYHTRLAPAPAPSADEKGNFLPLLEWKPGQPKPPNWPLHVHPPKVRETALED